MEDQYYFVKKMKKFRYNDCDVHWADHYRITSCLELDLIYNLKVGRHGYFRYSRDGKVVSIKVKRVE